MPKKSKEIWKTYKNVFDDFTLRTVFKLMSQRVIEGLVSPIKIGKESNVFSAETSTGMAIVKIYRLEGCNFNKMFDYIKEDERYFHLRKRRREIIFAWVQREYRNLMKARDAGVRVPTPFTFKNNVIAMEFIGDNEIANELKDNIPKEPETFLQELLKNLNKLYKAGLVHGDLSEFNILNYHDKPVIIDMSQTTPIRSSNSEELMLRDAKNLVRFFKKTGLILDAAELVKKIKA